MRPDLCMKISWGCEDSYLSYQLHQRFEIAVGEPYPHLSGTLWQSCSEVLSCLSLAAAFFLSSGVVCPVSHDVGSQLLPGTHEWWKVIFLKGSYLPTLSCCSAGRSQEIWHLELFQVHLGCGWAACCPRRCLGGCLARQILHSVSMEEPCFWCIGCCNPYCSQNVALGRAKQRQTSTPGVSWLGCPVPPSLCNRAGLSSPISLLGPAGFGFKRNGAAPQGACF